MDEAQARDVGTQSLHGLAIAQSAAQEGSICSGPAKPSPFSSSSLPLTETSAMNDGVEAYLFTQLAVQHHTNTQRVQHSLSGRPAPATPDAPEQASCSEAALRSPAEADSKEASCLPARRGALEERSPGTPDAPGGGKRQKKVKKEAVGTGKPEQAMDNPACAGADVPAGPEAKVPEGTGPIQGNVEEAQRRGPAGQGEKPEGQGERPGGRGPGGRGQERGGRG